MSTYAAVDAPRVAWALELSTDVATYASFAISKINEDVFRVSVVLLNELRQLDEP